VVAPGNAAALQVLDSTVQLRLTDPRIHAKAGRVCLRMAAAKYTREQISNTVLALVARSEVEMEPAFAIFAGLDRMIDSIEFREAIPMLG